MEPGPLISICIPAYKQVDFLQRLLDSICIQTFRDFEVILTDDSPDHAVAGLVSKFNPVMPIRYIKNPVALGTPENWNEGIRQARGTWIKLMHDDDWFAGPDSLEAYATAIRQFPAAEFIFSAYEDQYLDTGRKQQMLLPAYRYRKMKQNPVSLISRNIVGPPSVLIHRKKDDIYYDDALKWLVDIDFYIRFLQHTRSAYIRRVLVCVGLSQAQVTATCFGNKYVEIPENFYLLHKIGRGALKNIMLYDAWWRLLRNLGMDSPEAIRAAGYSGPLPATILSMMAWQKRFPAKILQLGVVSKTGMLLHYICNYPKIAR